MLKVNIVSVLNFFHFPLLLKFGYLYICLTAERRVQFQADRRSTLKTTLPSPVSPPVTDRLTARRQTEPAINVHHDLLAGTAPHSVFISVLILYISYSN
jgi:hypothetical protein